MNAKLISGVIFCLGISTANLSSATEHCTTITARNNDSATTIPTAYTSAFWGVGGGQYTKMAMGTVLNNPDGAADIANSQIKVPSWATHVKVTGHIDFPPQTNGNGYASMHLFRNNEPTPEAFYHVRVYYPTTATAGAYVAAYGSSPIIPVQSDGETWQLYGWQNSGAPVDVGGNAGTWLEVCFYQ